MAYTSIQNLFAQVAQVTPDQFQAWRKAWQVAVENGSMESFVAFICREQGITEELFLQQLGRALNWPYLELPKITIPTEARNKISTKVAFQYSVLPTAFEDGALQVVVSNPFDSAMLNAVRFDARGPV